MCGIHVKVWSRSTPRYLIDKTRSSEVHWHVDLEAPGILQVGAKILKSSLGIVLFVLPNAMYLVLDVLSVNLFTWNQSFMTCNPFSAFALASSQHSP
jgi:hypothetical protein